MSLTFYCGIALTAALAGSAIVSWILLILGRFKTCWIMPVREGDKGDKGKKWFIMQSFGLFFAAMIVFLRTLQLQDNHLDNVMENLIYAVSGFLLVRAVGEFKVMGLFRTENDGAFARFDKNVFTPMAWLMFLLSLVLL
jgi:hypothetical protein